jgi:8-oxo-dGTP pyrophosphatase MutT (NUDIX family)
VSDAVAREAEEETGIRGEVGGLVGMYTNPHHVMAYDDGELRQQFSLCFRARILAGGLGPGYVTFRGRASAPIFLMRAGPRRPTSVSVSARARR